MAWSTVGVAHGASSVLTANVSWRLHAMPPNGARLWARLVSEGLAELLEASGHLHIRRPQTATQLRLC